MLIRRNLTLFVALLLLSSPAAVENSVQKPGAGRPAAKTASVPPSAGPDYVEVVDASGRRSQINLGTIKKASTGPIIRNSESFGFTPVLAVMKAAKIPETAQVRVVGTAAIAIAKGEMVLSKGGTYDPADFGFIFNRRGRPVLTPRPGSRHAAAPRASDRPQVVDVTTIAVVVK